jgi:hypothetical protein
MDYVLRLLVDRVIRASWHRPALDRTSKRSNDVDYPDAGIRFDTVLTFLALRWSLSVSRRATQPEKIEVHSSGALPNARAR